MNARDRRLFAIIRREMFKAAELYRLPLKDVTLLRGGGRNKETYGICYRPDNTIAIRLRWPTGRSLKSYAIFDTMAHELAHLRHWEHNNAWMKLHAALLMDMTQAGVYQKLNRKKI